MSWKQQRSGGKEHRKPEAELLSWSYSRAFLGPASGCREESPARLLGCGDPRALGLSGNLSGHCPATSLREHQILKGLTRHSGSEVCGDLGVGAEEAHTQVWTPSEDEPYLGQHRGVDSAPTPRGALLLPPRLQENGKAGGSSAGAQPSGFGSCREKVQKRGLPGAGRERPAPASVAGRAATGQQLGRSTTKGPARRPSPERLSCIETPLPHLTVGRRLCTK